MHVLGGGERANEGQLRASVDGHYGTTQLSGVEGVLYPHLHRNIADHHRHTDHLGGRVFERHDDRDRVVRGGIGVDPEAALRRHLDCLAPER